MEDEAPRLPASLGFRYGAASVHTSRTMMLAELSHLLDTVPAEGRADAYRAAIVEDNALGKPTRTTRQRTAERLVELYALDSANTLFRLLRHYWSADRAARPVLAFLAAAARDPLLREATPFMQGIPEGESVTPVQTGRYLNERYPSRFQPTTLRSTAQNLGSSWTQAGYLRGRATKTRARPNVTPAAAAFAVLLGYLCGLRGKRLYDSVWTRLLDRTPGEVTELVIEASRQGWLRLKAAGAVVEITFPGLLKPQEEKAAHEPD